MTTIGSIDKSNTTVQNGGEEAGQGEGDEGAEEEREGCKAADHNVSHHDVSADHNVSHHYKLCFIGTWQHFQHRSCSSSYPACALRTLGLLSTGRRCPHSGEGEDFLTGQLNFFGETAVTPEQKVEKSFPRWEINRHAEG